MGENTKIEWADHTFNPWIGCTKVGPPCDHCYAASMMDDRYGRVRWGAGEDRALTSAANWAQPRRWNRAAEKAGKVATVFCLSLGDIWDNEVDPLWRARLMDLVEATPHLIWLLLSKRIGNAPKMCDPAAGNRVLPRNAALGATMASQEEWDRDMPKLREAARVLAPLFTFASVEPMLGPINAAGDLPDWVIVGGESGPHARPMHPDWARSLRDQCREDEVPFLFKQWGEWHPDALLYTEARADGQSPPPSMKVGKKRAGRLLDGREHNEFPVAA